MSTSTGAPSQEQIEAAIQQTLGLVGDEALVTEAFDGVEQRQLRVGMRSFTFEAAETQQPTARGFGLPIEP